MNSEHANTSLPWYFLLANMNINEDIHGAPEPHFKDYFSHKILVLQLQILLG